MIELSERLAPPVLNSAGPKAAAPVLTPTPSRFSRLIGKARAAVKRRPAAAHLMITAASFCAAFVLAMGVAAYVATGGSITESATARQMAQAAPAWRPLHDPSAPAGEVIIAPDPERAWNTDLHLLVEPAYWTEDQALVGGPAASEAELDQAELDEGVRRTVLARLDWSPEPQIDDSAGERLDAEHTPIAASRADDPYARYRAFY